MPCVPFVSSAMRIARAQVEIAADIASGRVPATVTSFAELHDYVDANEYGGFCDEYGPIDSRDNINFVQDTLDTWIRNGRIG
jgi:hypothetical protein